MTTDDVHDLAAETLGSSRTIATGASAREATTEIGTATGSTQARGTIRGTTTIATAPKPIPTFMPPKPCNIHRTLSSSEYLAKMKKRHAFKTAHKNVYARCPMSYTDCFNTYNSSRRMCIEE